MNLFCPTGRLHLHRRPMRRFVPNIGGTWPIFKNKLLCEKSMGGFANMGGTCPPHDHRPWPPPPAPTPERLNAYGYYTTASFQSLLILNIKFASCIVMEIWNVKVTYLQRGRLLVDVTLTCNTRAKNDQFANIFCEI